MIGVKMIEMVEMLPLICIILESNGGEQRRALFEEL